MSCQLVGILLKLVNGDIEQFLADLPSFVVVSDAKPGIQGQQLPQIHPRNENSSRIQGCEVAGPTTPIFSDKQVSLNVNALNKPFKPTIQAIKSWAIDAHRSQTHA